MSTAQARSTGSATRKSLVSSIGRGPPRCRCRRSGRRTVPPARARASGGSAPALPRRRSRGARATRTGPAAPGCRAARRRWPPRSAVRRRAAATARQAAGGDAGLVGQPDHHGVVAGRLGVAAPPTCSEVAMPSAQRGLSSTATGRPAADRSTAPATTTTSSSPAAERRRHRPRDQRLPVDHAPAASARRRPTRGTAPPPPPPAPRPSTVTPPTLPTTVDRAASAARLVEPARPRIGRIARRTSMRSAGRRRCRRPSRARGRGRRGRGPAGRRRCRGAARSGTSAAPAARPSAWAASASGKWASRLCTTFWCCWAR